MAIHIFRNDESGYFDWIMKNPDGYVVNVRKNRTPKYMVFHTATCYGITTYNEISKPGGFTERSFVKVCANDIDELRDWVRANGRRDGSFSKECSLCNK